MRCSAGWWVCLGGGGGGGCIALAASLVIGLVRSGAEGLWRRCSSGGFLRRGDGTCHGCGYGGIDALRELRQLLGALSRFNGSCEKCFGSPGSEREAREGAGGEGVWLVDSVVGTQERIHPPREKKGGNNQKKKRRKIVFFCLSLHY